MALSTPTKTSQSGDDNPRHPSDAQREQQIKDCFGQMTQISDSRHKAKVEPLPRSGQNSANRCSFAEESLIEDRRNCPGFRDEMWQRAN
jgi:hypothetical protein